MEYGLFGCGIALKLEALDLWSTVSWLENDIKKSEEWCSNMHGDFIFTIFKRDKLKTTLRSSLKYNIHWKTLSI